MTKRILRSLAAAAVLSAATAFGLPDAARADTVIFGLGADNIGTSRADEAAAFQFEYHFDPFRDYSWGQINLAGIAEVDGDGEIYAGVGLALTWDWSAKWYFEGGLSAGYYDASSDSIDLGGDLQFRTLIGVGYRLSERRTLSIAVTHLSNAGIEDVNPGRNAVVVRYGTSF